MCRLWPWLQKEFFFFFSWLLDFCSHFVVAGSGVKDLSHSKENSLALHCFIT